jgi:hypothetical protein
MSDDAPPQPTIEEIEEAIPEERKNLSFGGPDQDILDVMDEMEERQQDDEED